MDEISEYQHDLEAARRSGDREREKSALRSLASCHMRAGQLELWIEHEKQALPIANEQAAHHEVVEILNNIATGYIDLGQNRLALQVLERALARARAQNLRRHEGLTLVNLARASSVTDPNRGLSIYHQAHDILGQFDEPAAQLSALEGIAWAELKMEHYERAIEWLERAVDLARQIEDRRSEGELLSRLAMAYGEAGQHGRAEQCLLQSVSCFRISGDTRGQAIALATLATAFSNQDKLDDAAQALARAREIFEALGLPEDAEHCDHLLASLARKRALRETVDPVDRATLRLEANPRDVLALLERAEEYMARHDARSALQDVDRALEIVLPERGLNPEARAALLARLYVLKSRALCGLGDWKSALEPVEHALRESPGDVGAIVQRGRIRRETGDLRGAIEDFDRALALDARSSDAHVGRGMAHAKLGNHQAAVVDLDLALELDPQNAVALSNRGQAHMELGHVAEAERDCRAALRLDPRLNRAYDYMAYALSQQGKSEEALDAITTGLQYHPGNSELLVRKAWVLVDQERLPEALDTVNAVLAQSPDHSGAYALRGQIHGRLDNYAAAATDLERATQLDPQNTVFLFDLAVAQFYGEQVAASSETLKRLLALDPDDEEARHFYERVEGAMQAGLASAEVEASTLEMYLAHGKHEEAIPELEKHIAEARRARNAHKEAYLLILTGSQYAQAKQIKKAQRYIQKGIKLARQTGDRTFIAQGHVELATIAFALRRTREACQHFAEVLSIGRAIDDRHYEHIGLGNLGGMQVQEQLESGSIGRMQLENERTREGIAMLQQACDIAHQIGDQRDEATYCRNLGHIFVTLFLPHEALDAFERAQDLYRELSIQDPSIDEAILDLRNSLGR